MTDLATSRYADFTPAMGVPVQTSIGRPKFPLSYELVEEVKRIMPWGLFGKDKDLSEDKFTTHYIGRLEKVGVDALTAMFEVISQRHGGARVVLLCFEPVDQFCHRRVFARWFEEQTGQAVPELSTLTSADGTLTVVCHDQGNPQKGAQP
jgi:hypothetical protein